MISLLRHGRTRSNADGLLLGRADPPLDSLGERQARAAAIALPEVTRVLSSPLRRAMQTAEVVAAQHGCGVEHADRLIELDYGDWDERPLRDVAAAEWAHWQASPHWSPPGGESLVAVGSRVRSLLEEIAEEAAHSHLVLVTHVSPLKAAVAWALGVDDQAAWRMFVQPASISTIDTRNKQPSLHSFNQVGHLVECW